MPIIGFGGGFGGGSSGASYINGTVATPADLPITTGTPMVGDVYLCKAASGLYFINRKPAGLYCRTADTGALTDWTYLGAFPEVNSDANWRLYNDTTTSKQLAFDLSGIASGQTRTMTVPNTSGTLALTSTFAAPPVIGNTTAAAGNFTTLGTSGIITPANSSGFPPTTTTAANGLQWTSIGGGNNQVAIYGGFAGIPALGIGVGTSAGSLTEVARFTSTGATISGGTVTGSNPVLDLSQTWNASGSAFTALKLNVTNTASANTSALVDFQLGGTSYFKVTRGGSTGLTSEWICSGSSLDMSVGGHRQFRAYSSTSQPFYIEANGGLTLTPDNNGSAVATIQAEAANTLAQRNSTNAQTIRLYRTFSTTANYERLSMSTSATRYSIIAESQTGSLRPIEVSAYTSASDPTSSDITSGTFGVWKNSGTSAVKLWFNDGGTMKSVALS